MRNLLLAVAVFVVAYFVAGTVFTDTEDVMLVPDRGSVREAVRTWNGPDPADEWSVTCWPAGDVADVRPDYPVMRSFAAHVCEVAAKRQQG